MNLKKFFKLLVLTSILFWVPAYIDIYFHIQKVYKEKSEIRSRDLQWNSDFVELLLEDSNVFQACQVLNKNFESGLMAGYSVHSESMSCSAPKDLDFSVFKILEFGKIHSVRVGEDIYDYRTVQIADSDFFMVQKRPEGPTITAFIKEDPWGMLKAIFVDTALALWIAFVFWLIYFLRNIENIRSLYRQQHHTPFWFKFIDRVATWIDSSNEISISSIQVSAHEQIDRLRKERAYYANTLEYTILDEIHSSQKPIELPYKFTGTVARVDINGYGQYVYEGNRPYLLEMKKAFEWTAAECAFRYSGLFEGRAGDMVVYVFRGENAETRAAAFVRDFSMEFSRTPFDFLNHKNITLFVKASIATSPLIMEVSPSKHDFDGDALYLTDRMFGDLEESDKEKNVLVIRPEDFQAMATVLNEPYKAKKVTRKEASLEVAYVDSFSPCLEKLDKSEFFLGNLSLLSFFDFFISNSDNSLKNNVAESLLKHLRTKRVPSEVSTKWHLTLIKLLEQALDPKLTATFISLGRALVPKENWHSEMSATLIRFVDKMDARSAANSVELLAYWRDLEGAQKIFTTSSTSEKDSYRLEGNYLLSMGLNQLSEKILTQIVEMIESKDSRKKESGIYAGAMLILLSKKDHATTLSTFNGYYKLLNALKKAEVKSERLDRLRAGVI
ncbi:adenylate cyclase, putative [Bdellovibrio bacteriovorus W]|nr:adenylate cyclase, putative [Bdellovibrio bacteriovorus W]